MNYSLWNIHHWLLIPLQPRPFRSLWKDLIGLSAETWECWNWHSVISEWIGPLELNERKWSSKYRFSRWRHLIQFFKKKTDVFSVTKRAAGSNLVVFLLHVYLLSANRCSRHVVCTGRLFQSCARCVLLLVFSHEQNKHYRCD
jgi:hypothetical protein